MKTVNITLEVSEMHLTDLERYLERTFTLISYRVIPDTKELYEKDNYFKNIVKNVKKSTEIRDNYINKYNNNNNNE